MSKFGPAGFAQKVGTKRAPFETAPEETGPPQGERLKYVDDTPPTARPEPPFSGGISKGARWDVLGKAGAAAHPVTGAGIDSTKRSEAATQRPSGRLLRLVRPETDARWLRTDTVSPFAEIRAVLIVAVVGLVGVVLWASEATGNTRIELPLIAVTAACFGYVVGTTRGQGVTGEHARWTRRLEAAVQARTEQLDWQAAELRRLAARAADAERQQSEFAANMSHELRTPLNIILGYADLALDDPRLPAEARACLGGIAASARGLYRLVQSVLQYAAFDRGSTPLCVSLFPVGRLLDELRELCGDACRTPDVRVRVADAPDLPLTTDFARLRAALADLLLNAIKFTPRGEVELTVHPRGDEIRFCVRDTGIGIPSDELARIFEPFRQLDGSSTRAYGGVGLGLAIVRRNVELLRGRIQVESRLGIGSTFGVHIPRRLDAGRA